jgi:TolA-binding protein
MEIINFLNENMIYLFLLIIALIFKKQISNFFDRITKLTFKNGDNELHVNSDSPALSEPIDLNKDKDEEKEKPEIEAEDKALEKGDLKIQISEYLENNDFDSAKQAFESYITQLTDSDLIFDEKCFFHYQTYKYTQNHESNKLLASLLEAANNDKQLFDATYWYTGCYELTQRYIESIEIWEKQISKIKDIKIKTQANLELAQAHIMNGTLDKAREIVIELIKSLDDKKLLSLSYDKLANIEKASGNLFEQALCTDKCAQLEPDNTTELFDSAYNLSEQNLKSLALKNYSLIRTLNPKEKAALNNLAIEYNRYELPILCTELYKQAGDLGNNLAKSNQGYLLLNAGFADEAEKIADEVIASKSPDIPKNIYSLKNDIKERREKENKKLTEILKSATTLQEHFRKYIHSYYAGDVKNILVDWSVNETSTININNNTIELVWYEGNQENKLVGTCEKETLKGSLSTANINNNVRTVINQAASVYGYVNDKNLILFSKDPVDGLPKEISRL